MLNAPKNIVYENQDIIWLKYMYYQKSDRDDDDDDDKLLLWSKDVDPESIHLVAALVEKVGSDVEVDEADAKQNEVVIARKGENQASKDVQPTASAQSMLSVCVTVAVVSGR
eukprot:11428083-Ditylum_brightwellii.AAC.1